MIFNPKETQNMVFIFSKQSANKIFVESILQQSAKVWQSSLKMKNSDELFWKWKFSAGWMYLSIQMTIVLIS